MLAELLTRHPGMVRSSAQCLIAKMIGNGQVTAQSEGRARRYFGAGADAGPLPAT